MSETTERLDGREVASFVYPGPDGAIMDCNRHLYPDGEIRAFFVHEFHGDHSEDWIVERDAEGREIVRHNVRYVALIVWRRAE